MKQSLRAIKKEATASALSEAAFQLALEHGMDGFVVEDIVQRAGYSRRTFANHFSCKEEAVVMAGEHFHRMEEYFEMISQLPEDTTPLEVMYQFIKMQLTEEVLRRIYQILELSKTYPSLKPHTLSLMNRLQNGAKLMLSELFGDRYPAGYNHFLAGAVCAAIIPMLDGSVRVQLPGLPSGDKEELISFDEYIDSMFTYLRDGF
ncbi:TetR/AcrR family transcriptional regulator [Paenibacillus illinoisensis]|uniref:TetR/AcrR family transcriptional regulator n=1 Tax=Paenibacillus illinoisensis TaxID=59845 RepID=UPI00301D1854